MESEVLDLSRSIHRARNRANIRSPCSIDAFAREAGFSSRIIETAPDRSNALIRIDASLGFSGHGDTEQMGDSHKEWNTDPLQLIVDGPIAYDLGTSDTKGAVAAMLIAARRWSASATSGRLDIIVTADEEWGGRFGAGTLVRAGLIDCQAILIGEPSDVAQDSEAYRLF